ncbi:hypothetical protein LOK74_16490 [Brevibacillus humidisoli]|uniref:hypothetical protein n=1 Tax=Brevibacillus humidisoli TaxID=2895522 RepID=UPI001E2A9F29|nr:hypothetical protein [Brevibacillus humidisoli]UFJ39643.1 hypothetical protein LOK74_16490 [Brevibacillus humidisoli]
MKQRLLLCCRLLLGIIFTGAGINGYLVILGYQPIFPTSPEAEKLLQGYLLVLEKTPELICGLMLCFNFLVPLALLILAPLAVNIIAFHVFVDAELLPLGLLVFLLECLLLWAYRNHYQGVFQDRASAGRSGKKLHL